MLTLYPSNKLEHLAFLLATLLEHQPARGFEEDIVLVESPGMQHWLSMALAEHRGIAMNVSFPLPVRFMWDTARVVLGEDIVPKESPFRREVLRWRIYALFSDEDYLVLPEMVRVNRFLAQTSKNQHEPLQRLQLAVALADLFEQYLLYRPDWLLAWEQHQTVTQDQDEIWQSCIWRSLVQETPVHPANLHTQMVQALQQPSKSVIENLPDRIVLFAINTMAPQFIAFLDLLAKWVDVHLFHLNPCVNYWGNITGRPEQARILREQGIAAWMEQSQDNPLLGNLGKQGRDLFNQLTTLNSYEISAFESAPPIEQQQSQSMLSWVQQDILDARDGNGMLCWQPEDSSILVCDAHSALREVQSLHDHLLHCMNEDPDLHPRDILVMCPAIEQYAPSIDAVFARVGSAIVEDEAPRIPCTVADRSPLDADPLVAAFLSMLSLPDSRFSVTQIMEYLALEPLQRKFGLNEDSLATIEYWLERANVHWGLDGQHKSMVSEQATDSEKFSWQWGLQRLMLGMISEDHVQQLGDCITVPDVEGQQSIELGRLMLVIERLMQHNRSLKQSRTAEGWQQYLNALREDCFAPSMDDNDSWEQIGKAIADLALQCEQAQFSGELSLAEVREILTRRFTTPDAGNHFMTGQVTFCSMLPMRSIPFKIIAILGLNDGEFPRRNAPVSIDIMGRQPNRIGDRSRRQEDRYLFLEAIISARDSLYLSYQGRSALNNAERQPSLVLQELMDFLSQSYAWEQAKAVRRLPLHPFSPAVFQSERPGFSAGWFRLANAIAGIQTEAENTENFSLTASVSHSRQLSQTDLGYCFDDPLAWLARQIGLRLEVTNRLLEDSEPFEATKLDRYRYVDALVACGGDAEQTDSITRQFLLGGELPDTPLSQSSLLEWQSAAQLLNEVIPNSPEALFSANLTLGHVQLLGSCYQTDSSLVSYHVGQHRIRRSFVAWVSMLLANCEGIHLPMTLHYVDWNKHPLVLRSQTFEPLPAEQARAILTTLVAMLEQIETQPVIMHLSVAETFYKQCGMTSDNDTWLDNPELVKRWKTLTDEANQYSLLGNNPYFHWFYAQIPDVSQLPLTSMADLYNAFLVNFKRGRAS